MSKKEKLIGSLNVAISALKNDTVLYDWNSQSSCNCGVVSQAVLGKTNKQVGELFQEINKGLHGYETEEKKIRRTWKNGVKYLCPITGKSNIQILDDLNNAGMSKEDIVHLEYMDNDAILAKSGVKTSITLSLIHI